MFVTFLFGIVSIQVFSGVFRQKCYHRETGLMLGGGSRPCSMLAQSCPLHYSCDGIGGNIDGRRDMNSDDFFHAILGNIQLLTLTKWYDLMYSYMYAYHPAAATFFIVQAFFVPLYCVHIFQAILGMEIEPLQDYQLQVNSTSNIAMHV